MSRVRIALPAWKNLEIDLKIGMNNLGVSLKIGITREKQVSGFWATIESLSY